MKTLPIRPLPIPTEPLVDYLERLANANGYTLREFTSSLSGSDGLTPEKLARILNGCVLPKFSGPVVQWAPIDVDTFGLQTVDFTHINRRWCPSCIVQAGWMRPIWRVKVVTICAIHRTRLLQTCSKCRSSPSLQELLHGACKCGSRFVETSIPATRTELHIARALNDSLSGVATLNLGETNVKLDTPHLVRMICYIGQFIKGPPLRRPGKIRELEDISIAAELVAGTAKLLADWPSSFWSCLESFVDVAPADASIRRVFGSLYHVLYQDLRDPSFQFLRDSFELFLLEHWRGELCGRHRLFSEVTIKNHRHQGLARVARAAGMSSKRLRKMIHQDRFPANQFNPDSARNIITVDKDLLARLVPSPTEYLDLRTVSRILGLKRTRLRQLVAHGAILADAKPDFRISNRWHFRRTDIEGFMDEIQNASLLDAQPAGEAAEVVTLAHALQFWRISSVELSELIKALKRREIPFSASSSCRLGELKFCEDVLRNWLSRARAATVEWVSVSNASVRLGLKEQVVYELVSRNYIDADVISKNGHATRRISLSSLDQFKQTYVSASELSQIHGTSTTALLKRISARPITGPGIDGGRQYFFRRDAVDAATPLSISF